MNSNISFPERYSIQRYEAEIVHLIDMFKKATKRAEYANKNKNRSEDAKNRAKIANNEAHEAWVAYYDLKRLVMFERYYYNELFE